MATLGELRKQAKLAPKYILQGEYFGVPVYLGEMKGLFDLPLVDSEEKAVKFSVGFDNEKMKLGAWNATCKLADTGIVFTVKYL